MDEALKEKIDLFVHENKKNILSDLGELVSIPSVSKAGSPDPNPFGEDCTRVLEAAMKMAEKHGMTAKSYANWYGIARFGNGSHRIGIFSHLDVVEVDDRWIYPPFDMTEKDGWLIGRGVNDDKCAAIIGMYTAKALKELGLGDSITLELYMGLNEEKGMKDLDRYISEQEQPEFSMVPDFIFPVAVGGSGIMKFELGHSEFDELKSFTGGGSGQRVPISASLIYTGENGDKVLEKAACAEGITAERNDEGVLVSAAGKAAAGFGGAPGINAIEVLAKFMADCGVLTGESRELIDIIVSLTTAEGLSRAGLDAKDDTYGAVSFNPLVATTADGTVTLTVSGRFPTTITGGEIADRVKALAAGWTYKEAYNDEPWGISSDDERVRLLIEARNDVTGSDEGFMTGGSTYAAKLKNAVNYGPKDRKSSCTFLPEGHGMLHAPDEVMGVDVLLDAVKTYIRAAVLLGEYYSKL